MRYGPPVIAHSFKWSFLLVIFGLFLSTIGFAQTPLPSGDVHSRPTTPETEAITTTDPQIESIVGQINVARVLHPKTLGGAIRAYDLYTQFEGSPEDVFHVEDRSIPSSSGNIQIRLYKPNNESGLPVLVFFHGGGFVSGGLVTHDVPLRALANRCNCLVVSVAYRLAPENPFPAAPKDCFEATKWMADHAAEIGGDPHRIAVGGDGAGGNLAAVVALIARDNGGPHLSYLVLLYPVLDADMSTYSWIESTDPVLTGDAMRAKWTAYVPITFGYSNPYISPAQARSLKDLPPALIITGTNDPVQDEDEHFARDLVSAGVPVQLHRYQNTIHSFFLMGGQLDAGMKSINEVASALRLSFQK